MARRPVERKHVPMRMAVLGNFFETGTRFRANWIFILASKLSLLEKLDISLIYAEGGSNLQ